MKCFMLFLVVLLQCVVGYSNPLKKDKNIDVSAKWKLVWEDDFNSSKLNSDNWNLVKRKRSDWAKHMTDDPRCYEIKDGSLILKGVVNTDVKKDSREVLTAGVHSRNKFSFLYGKIEVRAKLEYAKGAWPAIWMMPEKNSYGGWPRSGEIDIMEHLNFDDIVYQTIHTEYADVKKQKKSPPNHGTAKGHFDRFNVYGVEWYPNKLVFTLNGKETFVYPKLKDADSEQWPFDHPYYIILSQQLGGKWVGKIDSEDLPVQMYVDYVKVYQLK
ncbi:glycoside hydrolase family 16 protein [Halosquirtibacter xylanolyticus]|uniref:glycoside hydrolase family 16 protein n=1 Tax=Halosquirtibacter xylanolyticus TaxID=3374599 RepID=UPI00374A3E11|nr:glycoside hydrolase family 16 protein [Prolixibacteraceae bacterium]